MYPPTPKRHLLKAASEGCNSQNFWPAVHMESVSSCSQERPQARRLRHGHLQVRLMGPEMVSVKGIRAGH